MKAPLILGLSLLGVMAWAQKGVDPIFWTELHPTLSQVTGGPGTFHWYDRDGHYSLVGVRFALENGNLINFTQRLERVDNSGDVDSLDEYSLERKGEWKIGKQYLPFGTGTLLHESAVAISFDTHILMDALPARISYGDDGTGRTRAFSARVGRNLGFSLAVGDHIGTQSTSLTALRSPEDANGRDRGYQAALGMDTFWQVGQVSASGELLVLRNGETALDPDTSITDFRITWRGPRGRRVAETRVTAGWCRDWTSTQDSYRLTAEFPLERHFTVIPFIRTDDLHIREIGVSSRIRF